MSVRAEVPSRVAVALVVLVACGGAVLAACGGAELGPQPPATTRVATVATTTAAAAAASAAPASAAPPSALDLTPDPVVRAMLSRISEIRGLSVKRPVLVRELSRTAVIERIKTKAEQELPKEVMRALGEFLAGFELIPPDYDFVAGMFALIEEQVAGFYDPDEQAMFLLDDLPSPAAAQETLAHELVHALQDQHFGLKALTKYTAGESDRLAAGHSLGEGEAMSVQFAVMAPMLSLSPRELRQLLKDSFSLSPTGSSTPQALQLSLIAPYVDGYRFVQALRRRGGWSEVDAAWQRLPQTTEQLLHIDKYYAQEPPLPLGPLPLAALGSGWRAVDRDSLGEQGLRIVMTQWALRSEASAAAAGWGADRYVIATRKRAAATDFAVAWLVRFDSLADATEAEVVLKRRMRQRTCRMRPKLGPWVWLRAGDSIVLAAGPMSRDSAGARTATTATCGSTERWARSVLQAAKGP